MNITKLKQAEELFLAQYPGEAEALRPFLQTAAMLETMQPVELPDEAMLAADRAIFMAHVGNLPAQPVSPAPVVRLKGWMAQRLPSKPTILHKKELNPMSALIIKAVFVISMMFGAVGGTAVVSAASQPDSPLYPLKLTLEGARLAMAGQPDYNPNAFFKYRPKDWRNRALCDSYEPGSTIKGFLDRKSVV